MNQLVNDIQASKSLGLKPQTLRNWRFQRKGPPYLKLGRAVRYDLQDLKRFAEQRKVVP